jgi:hypothetical protein
VTRKEPIALLDEVKNCCDQMYEDAPDHRYDVDDELSNARYEDAAASFCDGGFGYLRELPTRLSDAIYKLENDREIR